MPRRHAAYALIAAAAFTLIDLSTWESILCYFVIAGLLGFLAVPRHSLFHLLHPILFAYLLAYPLSAITYEMFPVVRGAHDVAASARHPGMLWAVRAFAAMAVGFLLARLWPYHPADPREAIDRTGVAVRLVGIIGAVSLIARTASIALFGLGLTFIEHEGVAVDSAAGSLAMSMEQLTWFSESFIAGYVLLRRQGVRTPWLDRIGFLLVLMIGVEIVSIGSKGAILAPMCAFATGYLLARRRYRLRVILLGLLFGGLVYLSFAVITEYRTLMHQAKRGGEDVVSLEAQANLFGHALMASLASESQQVERQTGVSTEDISRRFGAGYFSFANLLYATRGQSPFENSWESLLTPLYAVFPRAVLDKPIFFDSGENARRYYGWSYGGISVSLVGSFYYAWGYPGIILGMAGFGLFLGIVFSPLVVAPHLDVPRLMFGIVLLIVAIQPDMTFQATAIVLMRAALFVAFFTWLARHWPGTRRRLAISPSSNNRPAVVKGATR